MRLPMPYLVAHLLGDIDPDGLPSPAPLSMATLNDAKSAFQKKPLFAAFEQEVYVGDATVDILLRYSNQNAVYNYALSSHLNPGLPDQDETANLILDYSPGGVQVFRARGLSFIIHLFCVMLKRDNNVSLVKLYLVCARLFPDFILCTYRPLKKCIRPKINYLIKTDSDTVHGIVYRQ